MTEGILVGGIELPVHSGDQGSKPALQGAVRDTHIDHSSADFRVVSCKCPNQASAPVVADPNRLLALQVGKKGKHVGYMPLKRVAGPFFADN